MEPLSTVTGVLTLAKSAAEISKKLDELWRTAKDRETKHQIELVLDQLHDLKRAAVALEDENRELREKLRFKSDEYKFEDPYWHHRDHPEIHLCPKCFVKKIEGPIGTASGKCLVCGEYSF